MKHLTQRYWCWYVLKKAIIITAAVNESVNTLRDALEHGIPHRRVLNLRKIMPLVGQKIQITCPTHNAYWSRPGRGDPRKVIEDYYLDAAAHGKQYEVLELVEGDIGNAHYYAARVNIAKPYEEFEKPMMAYINIHVRFFEWADRGVRKWTSGYNQMWWCKTCVNDAYFRAPDGVASRRPDWANDRTCGRVIDDVQFKPLNWNPDAKKSDKYLSKGAVTKLRHGDPRRFINGVAMDINYCVATVTENHKRIEGGTENQNWNRYRSSDFGCEWDLDGVIVMLEICSGYPRFALLTIRQRVVDGSKSSFDKLAELPLQYKWIDVIVAILAIQGHSSIREHPHLFGWKWVH